MSTIMYALSVASALLRTLKQHTGIEGIVAGGYLRDAYIGQQAKDIDVFIPNQSGSFTESLEQAFSACGMGRFSIQCDLSYGNLEAARVFTQDTEHCPVQIIELAPGVDPAERVSFHDFGLCQVWVGLDGKVNSTHAFSDDLANRTCTLVHCEDRKQYERSMRRWDRLKDKLVGFTIVDPFKGTLAVEELFS